MSAGEHVAPPRGVPAPEPEPERVSLDVLSLVRLLARRWRVTVPAVMLTLAGLAAVLQQSSPVYESTGSVVLLSPPDAPDAEELAGSEPVPDGQNPFVRYGDLAVVADILARAMDGDSRRDAFEAQGITSYEVVANRLERGPVIEVTGDGPTPEAAVRSTEAVLATVDAVLLELQEAEGADPDYYITTAGLEPPSTATAMYGSTVRAAIGVLAVGLLVTLGLAVLADALAHQREARALRELRLAGPAAADTEAPSRNATASSRRGRRARAAAHRSS